MRMDGNLAYLEGLYAVGGFFHQVTSIQQDLRWLQPYNPKSYSVNQYIGSI